MWFVYILRALLGWVDGALYRLAAELYDLMIQIASAKVFQQETIMTVSGRVYQLLGLIMLFKLIFSFITYVINPDDMTDKNKGYANLVKKIIISLCLIVITPWAFTQSRNLQIYIIEDKVIEYFVFGQTKPSNASAGYNLMYTVGKQFVIPYKCNDDTNECKKISNRDDKVLCDSDWDEHLPNIDPDDGSFSGSDANYCAYGAKEDPEYAKLLYKATHLGDDGKYDFFALMAKIPTSYNGGALDWLLKSDKTDFYVDYQIIVSTGVVAAVIYMLAIMCIDMAVRSVKLSFYEIIAPIPIISYVGFKDGKDSMLNKWFGQVLKTYADLFTRVAGLQIAVFFIDQLADDKFENSGNIFVNIFLILGALTFAKELPKILEGMGVKFDGGGFNLKKKYASIPGVSTALGAGAGIAGGVMGNWQAHRQAGHGVIRSAWGAFGGAFTGAARGGWAGTKDKDGFGIGKGFGAAGKGGQNFQARQGTTFGGRHMASIQSRLGIQTAADRDEADIKVMDTYAGFKKQLKDQSDFNGFDLSGGYIDNNGTGHDAYTGANTQIYDALRGGVKGIKQYYEDLRSSGTATQAEIAEARSAYEEAQKIVISYSHETDAAGNRRIAGGEQMALIKEQAARYVEDNGRVLSGPAYSTDAHATYGDINGGATQASNDALARKTGQQYAQNQANKAWGQNKSGKK